MYRSTSVSLKTVENPLIGSLLWHLYISNCSLKSFSLKFNIHQAWLMIYRWRYRDSRLNWKLLLPYDHMFKLLPVLAYVPSHWKAFFSVFSSFFESLQLLKFTDTRAMNEWSDYGIVFSSLYFTVFSPVNEDRVLHHF